MNSSLAVPKTSPSGEVKVAKSLVSDLVRLIACAGILGGFLAVVLSLFGVNLLGFGALSIPRNALVIGVFALLCSIALPQYKNLRLSLIVFIPVVTQVYQVGLAWDFGLGPSSLIRVLPLLVASLFMGYTVIQNWTPPSRTEQICWLVALAFGTVGLARGFGNGGPSYASAVVFGLILPVTYLYLKEQFRSDPDAGTKIVAGVFVAFVCLLIWTFVSIRIAVAMNLGGGVGGLLATRNVSDYNLVLGYLALMFPLAIMGASWFGPWVVGTMNTLLFVSALLGFSRVGLFLVPVLILVSTIALYRTKFDQMVKCLLASALLVGVAYVATPNREMLSFLWIQRLNVGSFENIGQVASRVKPGGEDSQGRDRLRIEGSRLFQEDPLWGKGFGGFRENSMRGFYDAHSLTFTTLSEQGIFGLTILYGFLGFVFLRISKVRTLKGAHPGQQLFVVGFLVWFFAVHSVGGNLIQVPEGGFNVNILPAVMLILYLSSHHLVKSCPKPG